MDFIRQCKEREISKVISPSAYPSLSYIFHYDNNNVAAFAFAPLLKRKKEYIKEIPVKTFTYGTGDRGEVISFHSPNLPLELFFLYKSA